MRKIHTLLTGKITFTLSFLLLSLGSTNLSAQCLSAPSGQYPGGTALEIPTCDLTTYLIDYDCYAGEYSLLSVTAGNTYTFSSNLSTDFITISDAAGTTAYTSGLHSVTWLATVTGDIRFYTHADASCTAEEDFRSRLVRCGVPPPPPVNDECSGAIDISDQSASSGYNISATESMPGGLCSDETGANDVWYKLTAGTNGSITVTQDVPSEADLVLEVLSGDCSSPVEVDCDGSSWLTGVNSVTFTATAGSTYYIRTYGWTGTEESMFELQATGTPLPVTGGRLNGKLSTNNIAQLSWTTFGEQNNAGFYIQRSTDSRIFTNVGFAGSKADNGNSSTSINYSYADQQAVNGTVYYRLQQTDKDGKTSFSNILELAAQTNGGVEVITTPNPVNNILTVKTVGASGKDPSLRLMDLTGKLIKEVPVTSAATTIDMSGLSSGMYMIRYTDESFNHTIKISKQ